MNKIGNHERIADILVPLIVIAVYTSVSGKGFLTVWPIIACTIFALIQPFVRLFMMDRIREPLEAAGKGGVFFAGAVVLYGALAMAVVELLI